MSSRLASHSLSLSTQRRVGPSRWLSLAGEARVSARARGILEALPWRQAEARPSNGTSKGALRFRRRRRCANVSQTPSIPPLLANLGVGYMLGLRWLRSYILCVISYKLDSNDWILSLSCAVFRSFHVCALWVFAFALLRFWHAFWSLDFGAVPMCCARDMKDFFLDTPRPRSKHPQKTPNRAQPAPPQPERHPRQGGWAVSRTGSRAAGLFFGKGPK